MRLREINYFSRHLSTLINAGLPLIKSLEILQGQISGKYLKKIIRRISVNITQGMSFSETLQSYGKTFPALFINMVRAGEISGALGEVLRRLSEFFGQLSSLRRKIRSALVYPLFVLTAAGAIFGVVMIFIVPTFISMFEEFGTELPFTTRLLIIVSKIFQNYWFVALLVIAGIYLFYRLITRNIRVKRKVDLIKLHSPILGQLIERVNIARLARTLSTLLRSGVPISGALETTKSIVTSSFFQDGLDEAMVRIREGESLTDAFIGSRKFPALFITAIKIGEESARLPEMLNSIAQDYEEEIDITISNLISLLEPLLIIVIGAIIGFVVISIFIPLINLTRII